MEGTAMSSRSTTIRWYGLPLAVFLLGVLSLAMLAWAGMIYKRAQSNYALANAIMDIQIKIATAHLWIEESFTEEGKGNRELGLSNLEDAMKLSEALLHGGESEYGPVLQIPQDSEIPSLAERIQGLLSEFQALAEQRLARPEAAGIGSGLDERFDRVFSEIEVAARVFEAIFERKLVSDNAEVTRLFFGVLAVWSLIVAATSAGLWNREARRRRAEDALQEAKEGLEIKVAERTWELTMSNESLSQELFERRRAEEALRESEGKFRNLSEQFNTLLDAIPDSITLLSPDLRILWANRGAVLAAKGREVAGRHCYSLWHDASEPCDGCAALRSFETGMMENFQSTAFDGRVWDLRTFPINGGDGRAESVIEIATDITEKTMHQREAERMAQLASLGELAAGVAHEINNPVNGIINCAELLVNKASAESREHELGKRIIREGDRIAYIVKGLLAFAREESEDMVAVQVRDLLADTLALTEAQMKKEGITLRVDADGEALSVRAQPQRLEQVFLNIINNARDALNEKFPEKDDGKALSIAAKRVETGNGPRVRIAFRDQGAGIPANVMDRVMNPFFSTKPLGKGTGLGLSISHGIIENHGGRLAIESVEGEFTEVVVELPLLEKG